MLTESRIRIALASTLACLLLFSPRAQPAGEQPLGRILYAYATSLRGVAVPKSETILSGDVVATSDDGSALVELKSGARLKIAENSSVRFLGDGDKVQAELLAGAVVSESAGKPTLVVTTSKFQFAPSQEGSSRYAVALSKEQETFAGAMKGNLLVRTPDSSGSYILAEGKYAAIPASSVGLPSQEKVGGAPTSDGRDGTVTIAGSGDVIQHQGQGEEIPLKVGDGVYLDDVFRALKTGRFRIALVDGSFLNVCAPSVMRITKDDAQTQQTQVELRLGLMRAEVVKLTKAGASFQVQTRTATSSVSGSVLFAHALLDLTQVCSVEGLCWVRNINPAIVGQVTLRAGQCTTVPTGLPPTPPTQTSTDELPCQISMPWHIGSLGEASSILLAVGIGAAVVVPLVTSPTVPF
ncbi:MAG: FecR domain-containing protein [Terriglobia bacterium]